MSQTKLRSRALRRLASRTFSTTKPGGRARVSAAGLRYPTLFLLAALAAALIFSLIFGARHKSRAAQERDASRSAAKESRATPGKTGKPGAAGHSDAIQTARNLGKAYYEQGKYPEAIAEFQKVAASGRAVAADHLDLGMSLIQANNLDAALGELTTAKQMDAKLTAIDYNLGILYKRELRYPDAEATLKRVVEADSRDPAAWFNLGTVYSAERRLPEALDAHQHVLQMGFGRGQNFYVASLFHTFTILTRLKRPDAAQKVLKIHEQLRDKVASISFPNPALEGGKYGAVLAAPAQPRITPAGTGKLAFADITAKLGIKLAASLPPKALAREAAVHFPPSMTIGDYDGG